MCFWYIIPLTGYGITKQTCACNPADNIPFKGKKLRKIKQLFACRISLIKILRICIITFFICFPSSNLKAEIFIWTDENGVKHYTNVAPAENIKEHSTLQEVRTEEPQPENQRPALKPKKRTKRVKKRNAVKKRKAKVELKSATRPGKGLLQTVNDPATANALMAFNNKKREIGLKCKRKMDMKDLNAEIKCLCDHMAEVMAANNKKVDAFLDLMSRQPELVNQMVKIEGVSGNWYLNPDDPAIGNRNNFDFWKKRYQCR